MIAFLTVTIELPANIASATLEALGFGGAAGLSVLQAASVMSAVKLKTS
jgi:hypothetical protein